MVDSAIADQIIEAIGGEDNVVTLGHCMTRLRFALKDDALVQDEKARQVKGVKAVAHAVGQVQLIIGTGVVDDYFDTIMSNYTFAKADYSNVEEGVEYAAEKLKVTPGAAVSKALGIISGSITPWLGCIMGSLLIAAFLTLFSSLGVLNPQDSTYQFFLNVSNVCLYSLPVLVGWSAAEQMQTNKYMGALLGAILINPAMSAAIADGTVSIFGLQIQNFGYTSTIVPIILAVWLLKYVEMFAKKICPQVIYVFGVTFIELIITVPLVYLVVGPVGVAIANVLSNAVLFIYEHAGFLAPAVAGAIMPLAVMGGVHYALFPLATLYIADVGFDPIIHPALMVYNMSIAGACLAYGLRSRDADGKSLGISSFVSALVGISEAGLFGAVLANRRVLLTCELGILISGVVCGLVGYKCYVPLAQSVFAIPAAADGGFNIAACLITMAVGIAASFVITYLFGGIGGKRADAQQA